MKSFCAYRVTLDSPIIRSTYDFETGLIDGVSSSKFSFKVPKLYKDFYDVPSLFGLREHMSYYHSALNSFGGLFVVNCYDVGFFVASADNFAVFLKSTLALREDIGCIIEEEENIFNFKKHLIGSYKTVLDQADVTQSFVGMYVDDDGVFLCKNGSIPTNFKHDVTPIRVSKCGSIPAWRKGYDGIIIDQDDNELKYKIENGNLILERIV